MSDELKRRGELEQIGGAKYLALLLESVVSAANVFHYAKIVRDSATMREMIGTCNKIIESAYEESGEIDELLDQAEQRIFGIKEKRVEKGFIPIRNILKPSFQEIERLSEKKEYITGIPSGFTDIDNMTAGFQKSDLVVIAGRPSMGKTAFCLNVAEEVAITYGYGVGIFSLEMSKEQVAMRLLCSQARVSSRKVRTGYLDKSDWSKLTTAAGILNEAQIFIDDTAGTPILELRAKARRLKARYDIHLIIVDYLQLIRGPQGETREREISAISGYLKSLAKELAVPVIAVSQLSRAPEGRTDRRPVLSDLRESGAIEQDADVVMFIYREERYRATPDNKGKTEVIIGKQRNGPIGKVDLAFIKELTRFENLSRAQITEVEEETSVG
ncbi:MAG: replicative DNA helicase [Candidatus Stahlbacteria bacterium]|nr:replicative DNA helicase [Candidatus Stahlbacteria bacterium]